MTRTTTSEEFWRRAHELLDASADPLRDDALRSSTEAERADLLRMLSLLATIERPAPPPPPARRPHRSPIAVLAAAAVLLGVATFLAAPRPLARGDASLGRVVAYRIEVVTQRRGCTFRVVTETTRGAP